MYTLPSTGVYTIEATSYNNGNTGNYTLGLSVPNFYTLSGWAINGYIVNASSSSKAGEKPARVASGF